MKTVSTSVWVSVVGIAGLASSVTSLSGWLLLTGLAILPPLVVVWQWSAERQSLSESIQKALR
jgi:hypothetical protein